MNRRKTKNYANRSRNRRTKKVDSILRIRVVVFLFTLGFTLLFARLFDVQVLNHSKYLAQSKNNAKKRHKIEAKRGTIYDRNGAVLAEDVLQYSVAIRPGALKNRRKVLKAVSKVSGLSVKNIQKKIAGKARAYISHRVTVDNAEKLRKLKDPGVELEKGFLRVYPHKEMAAQLLGFCGDYNQPLGGMELQYNKYLQGKPGWKMYMRPATGSQIPDITVPGEEQLDGFSIKSTIDVNYQTIIEDELKSGAERFKIKDGAVVLLDCTNGEVVGMASYPQFNPNNPKLFGEEARKNRAVSDAWEPGSTFKFVAFSTALEHLKVDLDSDLVYCENGRYPLFKNTIIDHKAYQYLTWRNVLVHSSNIGTMKLMQKLDVNTFYRYARNFGFGMISGVDLPGENPGILNPIESFSRTSPYYMSIGYEVSVTPLQLAVAYAAVANGGNLLKPFVMQNIQSPEGNIIIHNEPKVIRRVINRETSEKLTDMLVDVVKKGTGKNAGVSDIDIAGKTGTAQLYDANLKGHDKRRHLASFVGYFPASHPKYVLLVMMRDPKGTFYGGTVAAPVFRNITRRIISLNPVLQESYHAEYTEAEAEPVGLTALPDFSGQDVGTVKNILSERGYKVTVKGRGSIVASQKITELKKDNPKVILKTQFKQKRQSNKIPQLKGLSIKESLEVLAAMDLEANVEGHGLVVQQHPRAGTKIRNEMKVRLICKPL